LACSILPDHVHIVIARNRLDVEQVVNQPKGHATRQLTAEGIHPLLRFQTGLTRVPPCWGRGEWKVFLNDAHDIVRAIKYVEDNPLKEGLPPQRWSMVRPWLTRSPSGRG